jgi:wyosine [tRNA(Phe)-imidazoG37] synthetase (radical SAM superfamily)
MRYIFGPIISRRFGKSLGIDLSVSKKQCNFDCLYCELKGAKVVDHQDEVDSVDDIFDEIKNALSLHSDIDVLTLTANGEPTLYPYLNILVEKINSIKKDFKLLILSNASTIMDKDIQNTLKDIDIVKLSLDSVDKKVFKKIDRSNISIDSIIDGIKEFSTMYDKELIIEVLFVDGINDKDEDIKALVNVLKEINPTRVDLSTIDRPPAYDVKAISSERLYKIADMFDNLNVTIATRKDSNIKKEYYSCDDILNTLDKRPLTRSDIELLFDEKSKQNLEELLKEEQIFIKKVINVEFFAKMS